MSDNNLLQNGSFDEGDTSWTRIAQPGQIAEIVDNSYCRIGRGANYYQTVTGLTVGKRYTAEGNFKTSDDGTARLRVLENGAVKEVAIPRPGRYQVSFVYEPGEMVLITLESDVQSYGETHVEWVTLKEDSAP